MIIYYTLLPNALWVVWCSVVFALPPKKVFVATGPVEHSAPSGTAKPLFSIGLGPFSLQLGLQPSWGHLPIGQVTQPGTTVQKNITLNILVPNAVLNVSGLQPIEPGKPPVVWVVVNNTVPTPAPVLVPMQPNGGPVMPPGMQPLPAPVPTPPNGGPVMPPVMQPGPMPSPFPWETTTTMFLPPQASPPGQPSGNQGGYIITETIDSMGNVMQTITPIAVDGQQSGQTVILPGTPQQSGQTVIVPGTPQQSGQTVIVPGTPQQSGQTVIVPGTPQQSGQTVIVPGTPQQSGQTVIVPGTPQQSGQTVIVPGTPQVVEEIVGVPGQPGPPGMAGPRRGVVTRITGVVLQRNNSKPLLNLIKGH